MQLFWILHRHCSLPPLHKRAILLSWVEMGSSWYLELLSPLRIAQAHPLQRRLKRNLPFQRVPSDVPRGVDDDGASGDDE